MPLNFDNVQDYKYGLEYMIKTCLDPELKSTDISYEIKPGKNLNYFQCTIKWKDHKMEGDESPKKK